MSFESHSRVELPNSIGGEKDVKEFALLDELQKSLNSSGSKLEYRGTNEKHGACGFDGFSVGEASHFGGKNMVSAVSKGEGSIVAKITERPADTDGVKLDISISIGAVGDNPLNRNKESAVKMGGDLVAFYERAKAHLDKGGQLSEGGMKNFDNMTSKIIQSRS